MVIDAFCKAQDEGENAYIEANIALQQAGLPRTDYRSKGSSKRDREVHEMEEALLKRFEAEITEEERELLAMSTQFDKEAGKRRDRGFLDMMGFSLRPPLSTQSY